METIVEYVKKYADFSFSEMKFNEVDALVLSQFSYMKWDHCIPGFSEGKEAVSFPEIEEKMDPSFVFSDERYAKKNESLFRAMASGKRYREIYCNYYTDIIDEVVETQFSALTVFLPNFYPVIVFRGTDENMIGWKEDFNMAFVKPVPGQRLATVYVNQVATSFHRPFIICGHSKGGNLSVYSAMNAREDIQKRIKKVYSFDGPGFRSEVLNCDDYAKISDKICKLIPHSSFVGMILENHEDYEVIDSYYVGLLQHDPYSWKVKGKRFKRVSQMDKSRLLRSESFNEWVTQLDDHQLFVFVETLFGIIKESNINTTIELQGDLKNNLSKMIEVGKKIDPDLKNSLLNMSKGYFEIMYENVKEHFFDKKDEKGN